MRIGEAKNKKELIEALEQARDRRLDLRRGYETIWWNNIALVTGDHYAQWNPTVGRFEDRDLTFDAEWDNKKPRMVINHALTVARTELSKLTKSHPIMEIIANSDEQTDIAATKVGKAALDFAEWKFKTRKMRKNALWWMIQTGLGAIYVGYDHLNDKQGYMEFLIDPSTGEPTFDLRRVSDIKSQIENGLLDDVKMERYPLGELELKVFSPFQILPDETKSDFDEINDLITDEIQDIDVLRGIYGSATDNLKADSGLQLGVMEQRMLARAGVPGGTGAANRGVENACRVSTFWLTPGTYPGNKFLKNGVMCRWTSNKNILDFSETFPFNDGRMPFVFFQHIPTSGGIWPDCVINHIRGPNLEIDKTVSQLIENKDYMANPMWLIATQHKVKGDVRNVAGAIVRYRHVPNVPPPTPVQGLQMPQQVESLLVGLRDQILEISGQSEVARGKVPQGARSGVAVAYMQEEDDSKIAPTVENMEEAIGLMGSMVLERFSQYYSFERIIRFYRRDGVFDVRKFKGADLKNNTDVVCQSGSAMPKSKAARQQYTLELISLGILKDPHKIEEMLDLGQGEPDDQDKSVAQANRENNMMLHGTFRAQSDQGASEEESFKKLSTAVPVKAWHNHQVHIARHTSVMMEEDFDDLMIKQPEVARLFDEHIQMHQTELQKQQQAQMQMMLAAKGGPDGPPGHSPAPAAGPGGAGPGQMTPGVIAQTAQPDVIGGGAMDIHSRNHVAP